MRRTAILFFYGLFLALLAQPATLPQGICKNKGSNMSRMGCLTPSGSDGGFGNATNEDLGQHNDTENSRLNETREASNSSVAVTPQPIKAKAKRSEWSINDWHPFGSNGSSFAIENDTKDATTENSRLNEKSDVSNAHEALSTQLIKTKAKRSPSSTDWHPLSSSDSVFAPEDETEDRKIWYPMSSNSSEFAYENETEGTTKKEEPKVNGTTLSANETVTELTAQLPQAATAPQSLVRRLLRSVSAGFASHFAPVTEEEEGTA